MNWVTARDLLQGYEEEEDDDLDEEDDDYGDDEDEDGEPIANPAAPMRGEVAETDEVETIVVDLPDAASPVETDERDGLPDVEQKRDVLPAQVGFCELVRYLSLLLSDRADGGKPRVAIVITAWDMLDPKAKKAGPMKYLEDQFPMFAGRIRTPGRLDIDVFGMSIVGGNLRGTPNKAFRESLKGRDLSDVGYAAVMRDGVMVEDGDVTLPLAWALGN